jgi:putative ABC transport system ATP-binding protein
MGELIIDARGLWKKYRTGAGEVAALRDISLSVEAGTVVAVIGPSGSGKTTLLNLLAGLDRPDAGEVRILGARLSELDAETATTFRRRHIGFVFQFFNLIPTMTASENVALPLLAEGLSLAEIEERTRATLEAVGLHGKEQRRPSELSGGEMQRVAVARALVLRPALVLADEPTGNLDSVTGDGILQLLCVASGPMRRAVLLVTHSYLAAAYADRTLVMRDGQIVEEVASSEGSRKLRLVAGGREAGVLPPQRRPAGRRGEDGAE